jgi:thiamine biosynthesis lipoprotein
MKQTGIIFSLLLILGCSAPQQKQSIHGNTMGTTYNITYIGPTIKQSIIDSVLQVVNQSMSTYIPSSTISKLNQSTALTIGLKNDAHFEYVYQCAKVLTVASKGAFDYTVMPIVNHYGFGFEKQKETALEEWEAFIGHDKIEMKADNINMQFIKADPRVQIDFSAIAKGYGVDVVAQLLDEKGIDRYLVEIGGEVKCKGKNDRAQYWSLGIDKPTGQREEGFQEILRLKDKSMATSGNYRNIRVLDGKQYTHTIDT